METAGIRRTEYPTSARVELARGALGDVAHARLRTGDADVPAQFTADSSWDDGSVRALSVDFNVTIGPVEQRTYRLEYGPGVQVPPFTGRGLTVAETADAIQAGNVRFGRTGAPLVLSAAYVKAEFIGTGENGLAVVDAAGVRHDLSTAQGLTVDLVKRGPLNVTLRYAGRLPIDAGYSAPFVLTLEMPNSKSWVKMSAAVQDPQRRLRTIAFDVPLTFGAHPWTWDFGTGNGTYGAFRNAADAAVLLQPVTAKGPAGWTVHTGAEGTPLRPYEQSAAGVGLRGWGHLLDARSAVAFAVDRFAQERGLYRIALNGRGQASFSLESPAPPTEHRLSVYLHFVSTPVPIGAATSPAAMLSPLRVDTKAP